MFVGLLVLDQCCVNPNFCRLSHLPYHTHPCDPLPHHLPPFQVKPSMGLDQGWVSSLPELWYIWLHDDDDDECDFMWPLWFCCQLKEATFQLQPIAYSEFLERAMCVHCGYVQWRCTIYSLYNTVTYSPTRQFSIPGKGTLLYCCLCNIQITLYIMLRIQYTVTVHSSKAIL